MNCRSLLAAAIVAAAGAVASAPASAAPATGAALLHALPSADIVQVQFPPPPGPPPGVRPPGRPPGGGPPRRRGGGGNAAAIGAAVGIIGGLIAADQYRRQSVCYQDQRVWSNRQGRYVIRRVQVPCY